VLGAGCSSIGGLMKDSAKLLWSSARPKQEVASQLVAKLRTELPVIARTMLAQAASMEAAKPSTRFEMVRRAHLAQAYLHAVTHRSLDLAEVASAVGYSQFKLLRAFQHCFGETPATYHRKLRLDLALAETRRRGVPIGAVCDEFGFGCASSFSHAYRRAFGRAPVWSRREAAEAGAEATALELADETSPETGRAGEIDLGHSLADPQPPDIARELLPDPLAEIRVGSAPAALQLLRFRRGRTAHASAVPDRSVAKLTFPAYFRLLLAR
jgi:AraC-like DNA-binding protein